MTIPTDYNAEIVRHTRVPMDSRITPNKEYELITMKLSYPRFILAEMNTHRSLVKNTASSRAIPTTKLIEAVEEAPFIPERFVANSKGMKAKSYIDFAPHYAECESSWRDASSHAAQTAHALYQSGVHKQHVNRILEPFLFTTQLITGCRWAWDHFFALRCDENAQPEMQKIANLAHAELQDSVPHESMYHIPFVGDESDMYDAHTYKEMAESLASEQPEAYKRLSDPMEQGESSGLKRSLIIGQLIVSTARCARVSYNNFQGKQDPEADWDLFNKLICEYPPHASPAEHQGIRAYPFNVFAGIAMIPSPIQPWAQWRKMLAHADVIQDKLSY